MQEQVSPQKEQTMSEETPLASLSIETIRAAEAKFVAFLQELPEDERAALGHQMRSAVAAAESEVQVHDYSAQDSWLAFLSASQSYVLHHAWPSKYVRN